MRQPTEHPPARDALESLRQIGAPRVLVVGDLILDHYVWGGVDRISPEAPIPVLAVREEEDRLGGAGNVAANLAALGAEVYLVGAIGDDAAGGRYLELCHRAGVRARTARAADRPTITKTRYIAQSQQVLRVDRERTTPLEARAEDALVETALELMALADILLVSDYGKGALSEAALRRLFAKARQRGIHAVVDPKRADLARYYRGATVVKPNRREAALALGRPLDDRAALEAGLAELVARLDLSAAVVTLGAEGIAYLERGGKVELIPGRARAVFDVSGAGDTVLAVLGLVLGGGRSLAEAALAANEAGGIVVGKLGTACVTREEIRRSLAGSTGVEGGKLVDRAVLAELVTTLRQQDLVVAFTNGCFDLVHPGHIRLLEQARAQGDVLVVAINSDASVRALKGPGRPIQDQLSRARVLGAFESVDYVVVFDEPDPCALLRELRPDVLVKGADWRGRGGIVGAEIVEAHGGRAMYVDVVDGHSTTRMVEELGGENAARDELDPPPGPDELDPPPGPDA